jgi:2-haloacid dehalogenase
VGFVNARDVIGNHTQNFLEDDTKMSCIKAIVFDAYGTLFDVQGSMKQRFNEVLPGIGEQIREIWRRKYHEYNLFRSVTNQYKDFWGVTNDALAFALKQYNVEVTEALKNQMLEQYYHVKPFDGVSDGLKSLRTYDKMILSNGTFDMLNKMVINSGLKDHFIYIISSDEVRNYKPSMNVYELAERKLEVNSKNSILFISSNAWDVAAAKIYGFKVCWLNRSKGIFEELDCKPDHEISELMEITKILRIYE